MGIVLSLTGLMFSGTEQPMIFAPSPNHYALSKIVFITPPSINVAKMFFNTINAIGPINIPITPINLNPVYIANNVNIGCTPIFLLTSLGSKNCLIIDIIIHNIIIVTPNLKSPFSPQATAHGTIAVPEPNIGNASTNPIPIAIRSGNCMSNPKNF